MDWHSDGSQSCESCLFPDSSGELSAKEGYLLCMKDKKGQKQEQQHTNKESQVISETLTVAVNKTSHTKRGLESMLFCSLFFLRCLLCIFTKAVNTNAASEDGKEQSSPCMLTVFHRQSSH